MDRSDRKRTGIDRQYRAMLEQLATASEPVWKEIMTVLSNSEPGAREERMATLAAAGEEREEHE